MDYRNAPAHDARRWKRFATGVGIVTLLTLQTVLAADWGTFTLVSSTLGNNAGRLCMGATAGLRVGDIGCPTYAPSLTTAGDVSVTGNLSAAYFVGDGSLMTGISTDAKGDRISTTGVVDGIGLAMVATDGDIISFTTRGVNTAYLDSSGRYIGPGVSITTYNGVSSTNGYFSENVGIGTTTPTQKLDVSGNIALLRSGTTTGLIVDGYQGTGSTYGTSLYS